jgi:hypothetical protein
MDADNWLREIEKKMELTEPTEEECVTVVTHQLIGTASAWWDSYCDSHLDPLHIGWDEFVEACSLPLLSGRALHHPCSCSCPLFCRRPSFTPSLSMAPP